MTNKERLTIVKVGGAVVEDDSRLRHLLSQFMAIDGRKLLVHGGGRRATQVAGRLGIESTMVKGRRVTDASMLEVVTMVYGGLVNKHIVASLQAIGINAIGLTGADAGIITAHRREPKRLLLTAEELAALPQFVADGQPGADAYVTVDYGFVGDVDRADGAMLGRLVESGLVPVVAPLTHDGCGSLLNTNADTMAQTVACALAADYEVTLVYAFEKPGVLASPDDDTSVIPQITRQDFARLTADGTISGGMLPKIENALCAVEAGVREVVITSAEGIAGTGGTRIV